MDSMNLKSLASDWTGLKFENTGEDEATIVMVKQGTIPPDVSLMYSTDDGETWNDFVVCSSVTSRDGTIITLPSGFSVCFKAGEGGNQTFARTASAFNRFVMSGSSIKASGNINSLLDGENFEEIDDLGGRRYCFCRLFYNCTSLVNVSELQLPATTVASYCYAYMFSGCTSLTQAPELPATSLASNCYYYTFSGCTNLDEVTYGAPTFDSSFTTTWLNGVSSTGTFYYTNPNLETSTIPRNSSGVPEGWEIQRGGLVPILNPLRLTSLEDNNVLTLVMQGTPHAVSLEYRTNSNQTWQTYTIGTQITLANGSWAEFRNTAGVLSKGSNGYYQFTMTKTMTASGNTNSMLDWRDNTCPITESCFRLLFVNSKLTSCPELPATTLARDCYFGLFRGIKTLTTNLPELPATNLAWACYSTMFYDSTNVAVCPELPATQMADWCYDQMFQGCSITTPPALPSTNLALRCYNGMFLNCRKLTSAPALPATTLAQYCYSQMFQNCTSLTTAPELPATTLANYCYNQMFMGCTSLVQAPQLPATTLAGYCYFQMFMDCTTLPQAPELPATTLALHCYRQMFQSCKSLTQAPALPAQTMTDWCYLQMFWGCTSLTQAPELPATTLAANCYYKMFYGCPNVAEVIYGAPIFVSAHTFEWLWNVYPTGTFYCTNPNLETSTIPRSISGVPEGWQIKRGRPTDKRTFNIGGKTVSTLYLNGKPVKTLFCNNRKIYG